MSRPYAPLIQIKNGWYYPEPYSRPDLASLRYGLISLGLFSALSVLSTSLLIMFLLKRFVTWKSHYGTFVGYNQYVVLVLNLLLADLQQSMAFLISWHWFRENKILAPSKACFVQGWLLHSGDVGNGFFILAIAMHTFYTAIYSGRLSRKAFAAAIIFIWALAYSLTGIGVAVHGHDKYFTAAGAWCWVSPFYETERLWCHYVWIFMVEFGVVIIYCTTFIGLKRKTRQFGWKGERSTGNGPTIKAVNRITKLMTIYPCVYVVLTLPLSAGRMWSLSNSGRPTSGSFSIVAGSLITSCGWVDSILYVMTRKRLIQETMPRRTPVPDRSVHSTGIVKMMTVSVGVEESTEYGERRSLGLRGSKEPILSCYEDDIEVACTTNHATERLGRKSAVGRKEIREMTVRPPAVYLPPKERWME